MLQIFNSLTRQKEPFQSIEPGKVRMYVCGMTVYDYCHIGHARVLVSFDVISRYLRSIGYHVAYVRNITDIDDKIIRRAQENGESIPALTDRFIHAMHEDSAAAGQSATGHQEPRATEAIAGIIAMVQRLVENGYAYLGTDGDVYFAVSRFPTYGQLANSNLDDLRAGARVEVEEAKRSIRWTSCCGKPQSPVSRTGNHPGATVGRAGILNAPP